MPPIKHTRTREDNEGMKGINRFHSIDNRKLAKELGAKPKNFERQKRQFSEILIWFERNLIVREGETLSLLSEESLVNTLIEKLGEIKELYLLPLFARDSHDISDLTWQAFMHFYLSKYVQGNLQKRSNFLLSVTSENLPSKIIEERDIELEMILGTLLCNNQLAGTLYEKNEKLLLRMQEGEEKYTILKAENQSKSDKLLQKAWGENGLLVTALFVNNIVSRENPEHDIPHLDEFLCYNDSMFFHIFMTDSIFKNIYLLQNWITARSDLLADTSSETYKLFCTIFFLGEEGLFDKEGIILTEASLKIPDEFSKSLKIVEQKRKALIHKQKIYEEGIILQESIKKRIHSLLSEELAGGCSDDFVLSLQDMPSEIEIIEVTIFKNKKSYARASIKAPFGNIIDLKECRFDTFNPTKNNQLWNTISNWKGGDTYMITIGGKIKSEKTPEKTLKTWTQEKEIKMIAPSPTIKEIELGTRQRVNINIQNIPVNDPRGVSTTPISETIQERIEKEKKDLEVAIEFFIAEKSNELHHIFIDTAQWDEGHSVMVLSIPVEELIDFYTPEYLSPEEYAPMLRWTARYEKNKWISTKTEIPEAVQKNFHAIRNYLMENTEKMAIDQELSQIGLIPSDTDNNAQLRETIQKNIENIDFKSLIKRVDELAVTFTTFHPSFNIYYGQRTKEGIPQTICLLSKGKWLAVLKIPECSIELKPIKNASPPHKKDIMEQRIENVLMNLIYEYIKNAKKGLRKIIERTHTHENTQKLGNTYRQELEKKTARLLIERPDGGFEIINNISSNELENTIKKFQQQYGAGSVGLLYRRDTYAFLGENCICKPSKTQSEKDYISLNLLERREILRERVCKTLFNGQSGIKDRSAFLDESAVYEALQFAKAAFKEKYGENITRKDISDTFLEEFIEILRTGEVLISYRDYCAGDVGDMTNLVSQK